MKEAPRNILCPLVGDKRKCGNNRKRRREEIAGACYVPPSTSVAAAALLSCLAVASALTHSPVRPRPSHHLSFCLRDPTNAFGRFNPSIRAIQRQTQLGVSSASRSSISLDEIPTSLERTNDRRSQNWSIRYSDLVDFKRKHGHTNVPLSHSDTKLAIWVRNQRHQFRHLLNGRRSTMTRDRYEKLCAIDFDFGTPFREAWDRRYQELIAFKKKHGHCKVPQLWDENPALSRWVTWQRLCYRNLQLEMKPDISEDRVQALEDVGFEWAVHDKKWRDMLERTQKTLFFVQDDAAEEDEEDTKETTLERRPDWFEILGQPHNRDVRVWIDVQRHQYARLQRDEASSLTNERIEKIERSIPGFQWIGSRGPRPKTAEEERLEEDWAKIVEEAKKVDIEAVVVADKEEEEEDSTDWSDADLMDLWAMEDD